MRQHAVDLELPKHVLSPAQMQVLHQVRLEVIEVTMQVNFDWFLWVFWWFKVKAGYLFEINIEGRFDPRFTHPTLILVFFSILYVELLHSRRT